MTWGSSIIHRLVDVREYIFKHTLATYIICSSVKHITLQYNMKDCVIMAKSIKNLTKPIKAHGSLTLAITKARKLL